MPPKNGSHVLQTPAISLISEPDAIMEPNSTTHRKSSAMDENSHEKSNDKYYKKFDFFYRRTAFRSMTEFYKGLFKPILDKWREGERKSTKNFVLAYLWKQSELDVMRSSKKETKDFKKLANFAKNQKAPMQGLRFDNLE